MENSKKNNDLTLDKDLQAMIDYANGKSKLEIEKEYGINANRLMYLCGTKKYGLIIKERQKAIKNTIRRAFSRVDSQYIKIVEKYMNRLLDDERIDKTPLIALSAIIESLSNNYKKIAEIRTLDNKVYLESRKYELEKKKILLELETKYNLAADGKKDIPIVEDFYNKLLELATPNLKEDGYGDLSINDMVEETKKIAVESASVSKKLNEINAEKYPLPEQHTKRSDNKESSKHDCINI